MSLSDPVELWRYGESMSFGPRFREVLAYCDVTQTALGKALGVTSQTVNQWANGRTGPVVEKLWPIAAFLGVSVPTLVDAVGSPIARNNGELLSPGISVDLPTDPDQRREAALLYKAWLDLNGAEREKIANTIEILRLSRRDNSGHAGTLFGTQ